MIEFWLLMRLKWAIYFKIIVYFSRILILVQVVMELIKMAT